MPNTAVDVNSWAVSACYPRRTFYPLSDGPSIQNHRITKTDFRPCSPRRARSQAHFCLYTHCMISDHAECTFVLLRYSLGGDRPSQTAHVTRFRARIHGARLESKHDKSGISTMALAELAPCLHSLPPILHKPCLDPILRYSKGS